MDNQSEDFSVAVIIVGAEGVPVVKEPYEDNSRQRLWKFPGGHGREGETPQKAAVREVLEETNIEIFEKEIELLFVEMRDNPVSHKFYLFFVDISSVCLLDRCKRFLLGDGITREEVKIVKLSDIKESIELSSHKRLLDLIFVQRRLDESIKMFQG